MKCFDTICPTNIEELKFALSGATEKTKILSGGTDLVISLRENKLKPDVLIDISKMTSFKKICTENGYVYIGAGVTFSDIEENSIILENAMCLAEAAMKVGSPQIRNRATLAGNLANASAAADGIPPLVSLNAVAVIMNHEGEYREANVSDLIIKPGKTKMSYKEIITALKFKQKTPEQKSAFVKMGSRKSVTISKLSASAVVEIDYDNKIIKDINIAMGSVGEKSFISQIATASIKGKRIDSSLNVIMQQSLRDTVEESIRGRSSMPYKREAARGIAEDLYYKLFNNICIQND